MASKLPLPKRVIDAHHHFLDTHNATGNGKTFQAFLGSLLPKEEYGPDDYHRDVVAPLAAVNVTVEGSVHVECMPDNGPQEASWVDSLSGSKCTVQAIVGSCDLASPTVAEDLEALTKASTKLRGVRWILDCVGRFEPNTATHIATRRHDGIDYLRGSHGPDTFDGHVVPAFANGFGLLEEHQLSFDLQCAPAQLLQAAELCRKYPGVPVVIDHLGKPRTLLGPDLDTSLDNDVVPNAQELETWKMGMRAMAAVPHVYVKLSMLGYAIPGWVRTEQRRELLKVLVREVLDLFGPGRCMMAFNWWKNAAMSDADGLSKVGPTPLQYLEFMAECLDGFSEKDKDLVFYGTARTFYRLPALDS